MNYTDEQLKRSLAKIAPSLVALACGDLMWLHCSKEFSTRKILDSELLHLCWLVEQTLTKEQCYAYQGELMIILGDWKPQDKAETWPWHLSWQQRTIALAKTKGIEIV